MGELLREIRDDIKGMKCVLQNNNSKNYEMNDKISQIENQTKNNKEKNEKRFEAIREEINKKNNSLEESVTTRVVDHFKPKIRDIHDHIVNNDLRRVVMEELALQKYWE